MTSTEQFRKVPWAPEYEVSDQGRVRSTVVRHRNSKPSLRYLNGWTKPTGYTMVCIDGQTWRVHRLVYRIFVGELIDDMSICHMDGDPANNAVSNLRQENHAENMSHKKRHGTHLSGETHGSAKHTQEQADAVRNAVAQAEYYPNGRLKAGERQRIAADFGVASSLISTIQRRPNAWRA